MIVGLYRETTLEILLRAVQPAAPHLEIAKPKVKPGALLPRNVATTLNSF